MKKSVIAAALALALVGALASCGTDRNPGSNNTGTNSGVNSGTSGSTNNGSNGSGSVSGSGSNAGQVSRRYNTTTYNGRSYFDDGRYTASSNGKVYDDNNNTVSRDLTQGARDIVRDTGDVMNDIGQGIGSAARDITGMGNGAYSGTPSWEPDSSAVRY